MDSTKLQDLIFASEDVHTCDMKNNHNQATIKRLLPKLVEALKEIAPEVKCSGCDGRGFLTGATSCEVHTRGKCPDCKGTGQKYLLEV